jgi:hypothetical protein
MNYIFERKNRLTIGDIACFGDCFFAPMSGIGVTDYVFLFDEIVTDALKDQ